MSSKFFAVVLLGAGCVTAAATGAYLAVRHNTRAEAVAVAAEDRAPETPAASGTGVQPVAETETVVAPPAPLPAPREAPEPRLETPAAMPVERTVPRRPAAERRAAAHPVLPSPAPAAVSGTAGDGEPRPAPLDPVVAVASSAPVEGPPPDLPPLAPLVLYEDVVVPASSVIGLQVETPLSSERARVEDRVEARVTRDVAADGRVAIPAGARAIGSVTLVERGGKVKERARLGVRFHTLVLADGRDVPIATDAIFREGEPPSGESARKIGGAAVGGAILGALMGGKKGAVVGGAAGAGAGTAAVMAGDRNAATIAAGTVLTVRLAAPLSIEVEKR